MQMGPDEKVADPTQRPKHALPPTCSTGVACGRCGRTCCIRAACVLRPRSVAFQPLVAIMRDQRRGALAVPHASRAEAAEKPLRVRRGRAWTVGRARHPRRDGAVLDDNRQVVSSVDAPLGQTFRRASEHLNRPEKLGQLRTPRISSVEWRFADCTDSCQNAFQECFERPVVARTPRSSPRSAAHPR